MIIECICGKKKFEVNDALIPITGRNIQCGSCDKVWFFDPKKESLLAKEEIEPIKDSTTKTNIEEVENITNLISETEKKNYELTQYHSKSNITLSKFLSYILVTIISFIALIVLIDTFKSVLYDIFPGLESILFSLFELLKDIKLFIKDLI